MNEKLDPIERGPGGRVRDPFPEQERSLEVRLRVGQRIHRLGRESGPDRGVESARQILCRLPVIGELGCHGPLVGHDLLLVDHLGERGMDVDALARQEVVVRRLLDEGMPEGETIITFADQDLRLQRLAERCRERVVVESADRCQERRSDAWTCGGRDADQLPGWFAERAETLREDLGQRVRKPAGRGFRREQLLREEGVTARACIDPVDQLGIGLGTEDPLQLVAQLTPIEPTELQTLRVAHTLALQRGQQRQERMPPMELVAAIRGDQHDRAFAQVVNEEPQQLQGRPIGPVDVLDDEGDRSQRAQASEEQEQVLEQTSLASSVGIIPPLLIVRRLLDRGHEPKQIGASGAQELIELLR